MPSTETILISVPGFFAGALDRGDGAEAHLVVLGVDGGEVGVGLEELFGDLLALVAGELAGLLGDDLQAGGGGGDLVDEALGAVGGDAVAGGAEEDGDLAGAAGGLDEGVGCAFALVDEVGADEGEVVLAGGGVEFAVDGDDGDVLGGGGLQGGLQAVGVEGGDDEELGALVEHVLDVADLLGELGLGVGGEELLDAESGGFVLDGLGFGDAEGVGFLLGLGEADDGVLEVELGGAVGLEVAAAGGVARGGGGG